MKHLVESKQPILQILLLFTGIAAEIFFLCNIGMRYISLGSITGAIVSLLIIIKAIRRSSNNKTVGKTTNKKVLNTIGLFFLLLAVVTTGCMIFGIPRTEPAPDSVLIVLGSGVNEDGTPTLVSRSRADAALTYIREHPDAVIITSGGLYTTDRPSEAESMKQYLVEQGVSEERILTENRSATTAENLRFSADLIKENQLSPNVVISTSDFHSYRAALYAKRSQLNVSSICARTPWWILPSCWIREMYAILSAWMFH